MRRYFLLLPIMAASSCSTLNITSEAPHHDIEREANSVDITSTEDTAASNKSADTLENEHHEIGDDSTARHTPDAKAESLIDSDDITIAAHQPAKQSLFQDIASRFTWDTQRHHPKVIKELNKYQRNPHHFEEIILRGTHYLPLLSQLVKQRDLPAELIFLPFVESGYNPTARSQSSAAGLWQFIPSTARARGMKKTWWYDERLDIQTSTEGALSYLKYLHNRFNQDWNLALAAYNGGEGHVAKQISKAGGRQDFWALKLKRETSAYVPKILAVIEIITHPDQYGVQLPDMSDQTRFSKVVIDQQIDLRRAAQLVGMSYDEFRHINPGFLRGLSAPNTSSHLLIPVDQENTFRSEIDQLVADQNSYWDHYSVQPGDTLSELAEQFGTKSNTLREINQLKGSRIFQRQVLLVPKSARSRSQLKTSTNDSIRDIYIVRRGDSLGKIALIKDVPIAEIKRLNNLRSNVIKTGEQLIIAETFSGENITYQVRTGDSLSEIASRFKVKVTDIRSWNNIDGDVIRPGQELLIRPNNS